MVQKLKIEKGIPIPRPGRTGKWLDMLEQMEPGDSVLLTEGNLINQVSGISGAAKVLGYTITTRTVEKGKRVWLTDKGGAKDESNSNT